MGIILGLGAALAFGLADFCARFAARQIGNFRTLLYMQLISGLGLSLWLVLVERPSHFEVGLMLLTALLAVGNTVAGLALYRAFEIGVLAVVSPIAASYGAVSLVLGLLSGQRPAPQQLVGLLITIIGVVLASTDITKLSFSRPTVAKPNWKMGRPQNNAIVMALLAALCLGIVFWGLGLVSPDLGGVLPIWEIRLVGLLLLTSLARPLQQSLKPPSARLWQIVALVGLLDTTAFLCLNFGTQLADSGLVSVLSSLFSAVTVILARLFLAEKLAPNQWTGILIIFVGIALVSAGG